MPIPTYVSGFPQDNQSLGASKVQIRNNLDGTFQTLAINHFDNNNANAGRHKWVELVNGSKPTGLIAGESTLYSKSVGGVSQLFFTRDSAGPEIQLTDGSVSPHAAIQGTTFIAGAMLLIWDFVPVTTGSSGTITFPASGFPNNCFHVFTTPQYPVASPNLTSGFATITIKSPIAKNEFTYSFITNSGAYSGFSYIAIGN